jgi:hypothetical protein
MKTLQDKHKIRQFMTTKPALQKILKRILHADEEERYSSARENKFHEKNRTNESEERIKQTQQTRKSPRSIRKKEKNST